MKKKVKGRKTNEVVSLVDSLCNVLFPNYPKCTRMEKAIALIILKRALKNIAKMK
jgi:hypothetical protein